MNHPPTILAPGRYVIELRVPAEEPQSAHFLSQCILFASRTNDSEIQIDGHLIEPRTLKIPLVMKWANPGDMTTRGPAKSRYAARVLPLSGKAVSGFLHCFLKVWISDPRHSDIRNVKAMDLSEIMQYAITISEDTDD